MKEILITSSVLIGALLLLRLIFAKKVRRRLIYAAWALVALRLLVPVQIGQLDFSVLTAAQDVTQSIEQVATRPVSGPSKQEVYQDIVTDYLEKDQTVFVPQVQEQIREEMSQGTTNPADIADKIQQKYPQQEVFVPQVQEQVQQQVDQAQTGPTLGQVAKAVWLAGVAAMAVWFVIVNLRHGLMLRRDRKLLACESPIPVFVSEKVVSPCLVGLFRPVVYLTPKSAASEETLRHVLTHELTHYRHGDHIWSLVRCVCLCVYWFDPLVWLAAYMSRRDCELACDEGALQQLGEAARIAYGRTLLEVVSHAARHANLLQTATSMNETKKQLKERVNFIVKKRKISITAAICMVLVCAIVAGCVATGPASTQQNSKNDPPATTPATTPSTNGSTQPTGPKPTEPIDEVLAKFNTLFGYEYGWYNRALFRQYTNPSKIQLLAVFHQGFEEESKEPTDAEWELLKDQPGFNINYDLMRLPVDRMNQVLMDLFGITLEDVDEAGFEGLVYLESTNCYYHMTDDAWYVRAFNAFDTETLEDGTIRVYYTARGGSAVFCVTVMPHGDGYRILSNITWPAPTTQPLPDTPTEVLEKFNALFGDLDSWYNKALYYEYTTPTETLDWEIFSGAFREESNQISDSEIAELKAMYPDRVEVIENYHITRLPVERINQVLMQLFGITLADMDDSVVSGLPYIERTDCYYLIGGGSGGAMDFNAVSVEYLEDGTIRVYYTANWQSTVRCVTLMPHGDGYRILSNITWPAPTTQPLPDTPTEVLEEFNALFGDIDSWYNMALTSEYATPEQINLYEFFLNGFPGEFTDEERAELDEQIAELEEQFGGELPTYTTKRLPADQMNQVLTDLFGITLEDVDPKSALGYLEKTNCYYIIGGGTAGVVNFNAVFVEYMDDGSIRVYYTANWQSTVRCVTLMPHGDGYRILSNVRLE